MLRRLRVQTAGESHGRGMLATVTGMPAGLPFDAGFIDASLRRRQGGFGRSSRQKLEQDRVDVLAGLYEGATSGAPLVLAVWNKDDSLADRPPLYRPRPGHADLAGAQKYGHVDMRPVLERASARETAARVAAGALAASALAQLDIELLGHVVGLGPVTTRPFRSRARPATLLARRDRSSFYCLDPEAGGPMKAAVLSAREAGDTLGGVVEVRAWGVPAGLGGLDDFGSRMDARLGGAILSIQAFKAVEVGEGFSGSAQLGSAFHDELGRPGPAGPRRRSNRAGGIEGGMTNGQEIVIRGWMKPIPTLRRPLASWNFQEDRPEAAHFERSDVTAVPAAAIVAEAMTAIVLLDALLEKTGGDSLLEVRRALASHRKTVARSFGRRPAKGRRGRKSP